MSQMLTGRGHPGGVGSPNSVLSYGRHHQQQLSAGSPSNSQVVNYSPHSIYTPSQQADTPYTAGAMHIDPFPAMPYTPVSNLFHSPAIRVGLSSHYNAPKRSAATVTSSKFSSFTTIYKLEETAQVSQILPGIKCQAYQTGTRFSEKEILLRRITNQQTPKVKECNAVRERFRDHRHPNLVSLVDVYQTNEFVMGENDIIMEYRYITGAKSLRDAFLKKDVGRATEGLLWSFACQIVSLLRSFHETLVPLRGLHWSKIVYLETTGRFYFTGLGMMDLLDPRPVVPIQKQMQLDIEALGVLLAQLATQNVDFRAENKYQLALPIPGYSNSFGELVKTCLEVKPDAAQLCYALGERMSMEVGHHEGHADYLLTQCGKELHNGRLMRLMMKLNFVLEGLTPELEYSVDNRYALRLFNQFLFTQVDEHNRVHLDWGHVYHCLNKLDCGSPEMIQLISADHTEVVVISYADLRSILESGFERLQQIARAPGGDEMSFVSSPVYPGEMPMHTHVLSERGRIREKSYMDGSDELKKM